MNRSLRSQRDDRGVVALEFVLALPFILMLIIGSVVLGNFLRVKTQTTGFARDGARTAALPPYALPPNTAVTSYSFAPFSSACPNVKNYVQVQATTTLEPLLRSIPPLLPNVLPATVTETVTMRCGG